MKWILIILFFCLVSCQHTSHKKEAKQLLSIAKDSKLAILSTKMYFINQQAIADFDKGIQEYTMEGTMYYTEFVKYYDELMLKKYRIVIKSTCVVDFSRDSYYLTMNDLVLKKYGDNFIDSTWEAARKEFKKMGKDPDTDI